MKKVFVTMLLLVLLLTVFTTVCAADDFVPSASFSPYPGLVIIGREDGKDIIGYVYDKDGNKVDTVYHGCIVVTPVIDAKKGNYIISDEAAKLLTDTYDALTAKDAKLSQLIPALNAPAKEALGENADADDLVIRELFDITVVCEDLAEYLAVDGNTLTLSFKMPVLNDSYLTVMTLQDGNWEFVEESLNNNDGTVTVTFKEFCPVLFLNGLELEPVPAPVFDITTIVIGIILLILLLLAVIYIILRRKNTKEV